MNDQLLPGIDHVIMLMFENRSFDNVLGDFYPSENEAGSVPRGWSNPGPGGTTVSAWKAPVAAASQNIPNPDPHEHHTNMDTQANMNGKMQGFVDDYATVSKADPKDIMQYFDKGNVPVTYALSQAYAVSDRYFASGLVQTWPNRLFSLCGTPGFKASSMAGVNAAYLNNSEYPNYPLLWGQMDLPNIFQNLNNAGQSWKVYFDGEWPISALIKTVYENKEYSTPSSVVALSDEFYDDVANDSLPTFSLIEPRYQDWSLDGWHAPNSNHPGSSSAIGGHTPISVSCGEKLLAEIYNALASNPEVFEKTLLIVNYDEHGGLFDHVYPPPATSPYTAADNVQGYDYSQYGVRVPALFINPSVKKGLFRPKQENAAFDHTSILQTLIQKFGLDSLGPRTDSAPVFEDLIDNSGQKMILPLLPIPQCTWAGDGDADYSPSAVDSELREDCFSLPTLATALEAMKLKK